MEQTFYSCCGGRSPREKDPRSFAQCTKTARTVKFRDCFECPAGAQEFPSAFRVTDLSRASARFAALMSRSSRSGRHGRGGFSRESLQQATWRTGTWTDTGELSLVPAGYRAKILADHHVRVAIQNRIGAMLFGAPGLPFRVRLQPREGKQIELTGFHRDCDSCQRE